MGVRRDTIHFRSRNFMFDTITIHNARLHNLKNVTLSIPKNQLVVFTGLSGSGKSTLALDTLNRESARQYFEALGMVTYVNKPEVDRIEGLSPSISIDQHASNRSPRSTVLLSAHPVCPHRSSPMPQLRRGCSTYV